MVESDSPLFAMAYQHVPELRRMVAGWEYRGLYAGAGLLAAYLLLRLRKGWAEDCPRGNLRRTFAAARLTACGVAALLGWAAIDAVRGEDYLTELFSTAPILHWNYVRAVAMFTLGWAGWTVTLNESVLRLARHTRNAGTERTKPHEPA